jgi:hypothetical protein
MRKEVLAFLLSLILTPKRFYLPHREKEGIEGGEVAITFVLAYSGGNLINSILLMFYDEPSLHPQANTSVKEFLSVSPGALECTLKVLLHYNYLYILAGD